MIQSHRGSNVRSRSQCSCWYGYRWWFNNFHPSAIRCKWVLTILVFCASVAVLYNIPSTTNIKIFNTGIQSKRKNAVVTFHLAFTTRVFTKLNQRCIESIFYFHPTAHVILHSNLENGIHTAEQKVLEPLQELISRGYRIEILPYTAADVLHRATALSNSVVNATLANEWMALISTKYSQEKYWYSNESNLLRLCLLYVDGGIYLDTDVILVRPMTEVDPSNDDTIYDSVTNVVTDDNGLNVDNVMARDGGSFECAVMKFLIPGNRFLGHAINNFLRHYNGNDWGNNGPRVFGRTSKELPNLLCPEPYNYTSAVAMMTDTTATINEASILTCFMQPLPSESFQPVPWRDWLSHCFDAKKSPVG